VVPAPTGQRVLAGVGASGLNADRDSLVLTIRAGAGVDPIAVGPAGGSGSGGGGASGTGGLAFTGTQIALLIALAAALLGGGIGLMYAGRRRSLRR
jgi:hypothetical protein